MASLQMNMVMITDLIDIDHSYAIYISQHLVRQRFILEVE